MRPALAILSMFCVTSRCVADTFPHWDVHWMCADADAIIVGEQRDGDAVAVTKWIKGAADAAPATIVINDISKHSKTINAFWSRIGKQTTTALTTRHFVAFLERKEGIWRSMATIEDSGLCGSCGMIWIQDDRCYRYTQAMNPGPYDLYKAKDIKSEADLMRGIEVGLHDADAWSKALNIDDVALRAQALAAYTLKSTSPESPRSTYRYRARDPLRKLGPAAVPSLRAQLAKWRAGDSLDEVVLVLYDLGQDARSAVPDLVSLLKRPERANPYYVISALRTTGDSSNIDDIKPFLNHANEQVRNEATDAINSLTKKG